MKIENQVCTLEQAKRLKELGVQQDAYMSFVWFINSERVNLHRTITAKKLTDHAQKKYESANHNNKVCAAFTVAELGVMLPEDLYIPYKGNSGKKRKYPQHLHCFKQLKYSVNYTGGESREFLTQHGDTEAEARATMLIHLLKNNLLTAEEVNQRLNA